MLWTNLVRWKCCWLKFTFHRIICMLCWFQCTVAILLCAAGKMEVSWHLGISTQLACQSLFSTMTRSTQNTGNVVWIMFVLSQPWGLIVILVLQSKWVLYYILNYFVLSKNTTKNISITLWIVAKQIKVAETFLQC